MSEAVEVIISADDQASKEFAKVAANAEIEQQKLVASQAKAAAEAERAAKRIEDLKNRELQQIELLRVEVEQGSQAAQAAALVQQGIDRDQAEAIVRERSQLEQLRQQKKEVADAAIRSAKERESAEERAAQEAKQNARSLEQIRQREIQQLQLIETEIKQGAAAARSLSLQQQGLTKAEADALARKRQELEKIRSASKGGDFRGQAGQFKASTEFAGSISTLLGGTEIGSIAGQMANLTEKTSQFSEVAKQGGAAAFAFKAGLIAATAAVSYQIGAAISGWIFQQKDLNKELGETVKLINANAAEAIKVAGQKFRDKMEDISLVPRKEQQKSDLQALLKETESAFKKEEALYNSKKDLEDEGDKASAASHFARMQQLKDQRSEIERQLSGRDEEVAAKKAMAAERQKSDQFISGLEQEVKMLQLRGDELLRAQAYAGAYGAEETQRAFELLKQKDALQAAAKAEEEDRRKKEQAAEKEKQRIQQLDEVKKRELNRLKEQKILLEQGEEAARKFALQQMGIDEATAGALAREEQLLQAEKERRENEKEKKEKMKEFAGPVEARESRMLSGRGAAVENMSKQQLQTLVDIHNAILAQSKNNKVRLVQVQK